MPLPLCRMSALAVLLLVAGCAKPPPGKAEVPPAPVVVATAGVKTVPVQIKSIGTVRVVSTVSVRPRVGGELTAVHFREGDYVEKGQKLFTIDPRPYETAVRQAEAAVAKNKAVLAGAERDLKRIEGITTGVGGSAVAAVELDTAKTAVESAKAAVAADEAALHTAKLQLSFTTITAPLDGRTGGLLVTAGNLVSANEVTPLVVINQIRPIYVSFALPEQDLPAVTAAQGRKPLTVEAHLREGEPSIPGVLAFIDNTVDAGTGTVTLKAEFPNADRTLWPGQFVDVVLTVGERPRSVVVPTAAVQAGQKGDYVFVVKPDQTAEARPVAVAFESNGEAVVASGLAGGEVVVVEGQLRVAPGAKVEAKPAAGGTK
jgi:multidrug efflux system membrane fusion protein